MLTPLFSVNMFSWIWDAHHNNHTICGSYTLLVNGSNGFKSVFAIDFVNFSKINKFPCFGICSSYSKEGPWV